MVNESEGLLSFAFNRMNDMSWFFKEEISIMLSLN